MLYHSEARIDVGHNVLNSVLEEKDTARFIQIGIAPWVTHNLLRYLPWLQSQFTSI